MMSASVKIRGGRGSKDTQYISVSLKYRERLSSEGHGSKQSPLCSSKLGLHEVHEVRFVQVRQKGRQALHSLVN